ncbi:uncharacterized protein LOC134723679 isoform X1 [Mytilus trossulus]|uniref:uncharacterized protein LOC134723679 isoform X1 n=1 Tax=Mytilus trossulus TaxID=6551 RepID=UPI003004836A
MILWTIIYLIVLYSEALSAYRLKKPKVPKADCIFHGHKHKETWTDPLLPCKQFKCVNGLVQTNYIGCIYKDPNNPEIEKCHMPGERWKEGCSSRTCTYFEDYRNGRKVHFYVVDGQAWCLSQEKECKAPEEVWEYDCDQYKCIEEDQIYVKTARIEKIGKVPNCECCKFNDKCYKNGASWPGGNCTEHYCDLVPGDNGETLTAITSVPGCTFQGKCYKFEETVVHNCFILECTTTDRLNVKWETIKQACPVGNRCINMYDTWRNESNCMEYYCNGNATTISKQYGCIVGGNKCVPYGGYYCDDQCYYRQCYQGGNQEVREVVRGGCKGLTGKCYVYGEIGFSKETNGEIFENCTCVQRGRTGSVAVCSGSGSSGNQTYYLEDSGTGHTYVRKDMNTDNSNYANSEETDMYSTTPYYDMTGSKLDYENENDRAFTNYQDTKSPPEHGDLHEPYHIPVLQLDDGASPDKGSVQTGNQEYSDKNVQNVHILGVNDIPHYDQDNGLFTGFDGTGGYDEGNESFRTKEIENGGAYGDPGILGENTGKSSGTEVDTYDGSNI